MAMSSRPSKADRTRPDVEWALATAQRALDQTAALIASEVVGTY
jgi:hypothetical protein